MKQSKTISRNITRRKFLAAQIAFPIIACEILSGCQKTDPLEEGKPIKIAKLSELQDGINGFPVMRVAIIKENINNQTSLRAIGINCTHQMCLVNPVGGNTNFSFICPCHGSRFDSTGAVTKGPAKEALPCFRVSVEDGDSVVFYPMERVVSGWKLNV